MAPVILYDIPSKEPREAWSPNPWKVRMVLNYKKIDYQTEWVEYPDLAPTFKALGIAPNDKNAPGYYVDYTSPAVRFEDGTFSLDSWKIAQELEKRYPSPSLHLDDPIVEKFESLLMKFFRPLMANIIPKVSQNILGEGSVPYFDHTRSQPGWFGMPLSEVEEKLGGPKAWEEAQAPIKEAADLLKKNGGPFFLGEQVSYADFNFVSFLEFLRRADTKGLFDQFLALDPAFSKLYNASEEWLKRAD